MSQKLFRPSFFLILFILAICAFATLTQPVNASSRAQTAADYTQGVTSLNSTQVKIWFKPVTPSTLVDVHYLINGANQQNFRMTNNAGTWEQTVSNLTSGTVIEYWFTYEKNGPLYDSAHYKYTVGSVATSVPTTVPPTATKAPATATTVPTGDYTQGVNSLNSTQAKIWFRPTIPSSLVDVHYLINGTNQQNFRMTNNAGTWEQVVSNLTNGTVIEYWFTYEKNGPLYDSVHYTYTHGGVSPTATIAPTQTFQPPTNTPSGPTATPVPTTCTSAGTFPICIVNNTRGIYTNSQIYITVFGMPTPGQWYYLKADGTPVHVNHLDASASNHLTKNGVNYGNMSFSLAQTTRIPMPPRWDGGRMYISLGEPMYIPIPQDDSGWGGPNLRDTNDPNYNTKFDWYELAYGYNVTPAVPFGGNTTQVDQFSFPMTARLVQTSTGYDQTIGITLTRDQVFSQYAASVGPAFASLVSANGARILAPRSAAAFDPGGSQGTYMQSIIDQTWNLYTTNQFTLTRGGITFSGRVTNGQLQFTRTPGGVEGTGPFFLNKPTSTDVIQCSGAIANPNMTITARELGAEFCAAFHRGVSLNTANWYSPSTYYLNTPRNDYSMFFHRISLQNRAYGFPYDDINDQSSVKILSNSTPPSSVTISVGY